MKCLSNLSQKKENNYQFFKRLELWLPCTKKIIRLKINQLPTDFLKVYSDLKNDK